MKKYIFVILAGIAIVGSALISGCLSVSMYATVQKDGNLSDMKMVINTTSSVYSYISGSAKEGGYSNVKDYILTNLSKTYKGSITKEDYDEQWNGDRVTMTMTMTGSFKPDQTGGMSMYKDGDYMIFKYVSSSTPTPTPTPDQSNYAFNSSSMSELSDMILSGITLDFYLTMPGKILDSNANVVKDNKAEWHLSGKDLSTMNMYAKSEVPSAPGFEVAAAIAGLIAVGLAMAAQRKN